MIHSMTGWDVVVFLFTNPLAFMFLLMFFVPAWLTLLSFAFRFADIYLALRYKPKRLSKEESIALVTRSGTCKKDLTKPPLGD